MEISELYNIYLQHRVITTDSRNCPTGSVFFALKGANFNGNQYAQTALDKGSAYAVVDEEAYVTSDKIILVPDVLTALQQLARYHRQQLNIPVIGITGTNGKTTTKELIAAVLGRTYNVLYTQGNLNNHIGVPLTLLSITPEHEIAVVEMGANHQGEIKTLAEIALPNYGIITNVGKAHLEGFGSFENIIKTKGELYDFIRSTQGTIFINADNTYLENISSGITKVEYSFNKNTFVSGTIKTNSPMPVIQWKQQNNTTQYTVTSKLIGTYNAENILAAICIGMYFNVTPPNICAALDAYTPSNNRSQLTETGKNHLIVDAYNANPTSMEASLTNFSHMDVARKIVMLGEMGELGENSKAEHEKIIALLQKSDFDDVFLVGKNFMVTQSGFKTFATVNDLIQTLRQQKPSDYYILIKGSRSTQMEKTINEL